MVQVFREIWRVLRDDGTVWLNLGDSFCSSPPGNKTVGVSAKSGLNGVNGKSGVYRETLAAGHATKRDTSKIPGLKPKDRMFIPHRVAIALQEDGWYARDEIVWHKRSPMPESVTDRTTKSHEMVFLLAKRDRYFYDADAVREAHTAAYHATGKYVISDGLKASHGDIHRGFGPESYNPLGRNLRSVWTLSPETFDGAHFATMPTELASRCVKAGTSEYGCCPACGAPWVRMTVRTKLKRDRPNDFVKRTGEAGTGNSCSNSVAGVSVLTVGWDSTCDCPASDPVPCRVLDPFAGSGTTLLAANRLGRDAVGLDLSADYLSLAEKRIRDGLRPVSRLDARKAVAPSPGQQSLFDMGA